MSPYSHFKKSTFNLGMCLCIRCNTKLLGKEKYTIEQSMACAKLFLYEIKFHSIIFQISYKYMAIAYILDEESIK